MDPKNQAVIGRAQARIVREGVNDRTFRVSGWSEWVLAMTPNERPEFPTQRSNEAGRIGYRLKTIKALREKFSFPIDQPCGIYEWKVVKGKDEGKEEYVVYIGCTCRNRQDASIIDRIWEYCLNGSHKKERINDALSKGYELWVRVKESGDHGAVIDTRRRAAEDDENKILLCYDYAWNQRSVGRSLA